MIRLPGLGIVRGMLFTFRKMFEPKVTVQYPEVIQDISPKHRGRLLLLYDEWGALKCETCFQCAQACPIECIDMGGVDTRNRFHVHWGPAEQYAERREESAPRRAGRVVPDATFRAWDPIDITGVERVLAEVDYDPAKMVTILERTQDAYGFLPVAALQHISHSTGAWYSEIYGIASFYDHLRLEPASTRTVGVCRCAACVVQGAGRIREALEEALRTELGGTSPDGRVRLDGIDCQGESHPFVTLDGRLQPDMTAERATALAAELRGPVPHGRPA
ncbi:MAG: NAD(P)H-dependent oxidoreductase subunit E [Chloroflexi bacterium]|nr:NAD(P)H-dependent oxidoreductase subunit E [Chloroflexota bacterium]